MQNEDKNETYKVLLADDEQIERMALAKRLHKHFGDSLVIWQAADGNEAVRLCFKERCQIVIMDISMPELNGVEAAEQIRRLDEDCEIIFLTAYDEFSYAKRAIAIHALDYLLKPCEEEELTAVMEEAVGRIQKREQFKKLHMEQEMPEETGAEMPEPDLEEEPEEPDRLGQAAEKIRRYIRKNYMKDISMQDAARMMNYSDAYFCKLFKQCFDQNFTAYLARFRINEARRLLQDKNASVRGVSMLVGYYDANYFAKVFKRIAGMNPSEYRDSFHTDSV
nr:response regulator [uncultured Enterocloster sp.]